jgi:hypothetical protein
MVTEQDETIGGHVVHLVSQLMGRSHSRGVELEDLASQTTRIKVVTEEVSEETECRDESGHDRRLEYPTGSEREAAAGGRREVRSSRKLS